ncbi:MAG: hypothetical protein KGO96_08280 [Elusimicrobia bacterium]|nr:hypothetical protein [Elusimicrobiota bacterium]MDE2425886.1 hypothetical protein [Elusimicrobiota bacterium]
MNRWLLSLAAALALAGCRGSAPTRDGPPEAGIASLLLSCRLTLPAGQTGAGSVTLNLEGRDGNAQAYRLPLPSSRPSFYQVEPGAYRLAPPRSLFGSAQAGLTVESEGRVYTAPLPPELERASLDLKPRQVLVLGELEVSLEGSPNQAPTARVFLDDSAQTRRSLLQEEIRLMMDPDAPPQRREAAIAWLPALEQALTGLLSDQRPTPWSRARQ